MRRSLVRQKPYFSKTVCKDYKNEYGHLCVKSDEQYKGHAIGQWCSGKRVAYNRGKLPQCQIDALNEIGFIWDVPLHLWNKRFEEYKAYVAETGDMNPIERIVHDGNKVGTWVRNQRHEEAKGKLNSTYKEILLNFNPAFFDRRQTQKQI